MRYNILHIIVPVLIGMACATSCSSDPESDVLASGKGNELRFEVGDCSTRATTITTKSKLTAQPFMLFGDVYRNAEFHPGLRTIFETAKVTYKNNKWDYGVKQYWHMGQEHSFVAIHPFDIPGISNIKYEDSKVSFTYEMPEEDSDKVLDENSDIKDIIVATHRRRYNLDSDNSEPVQFNFQHLLSRINISPALQDDLMYAKDDETKKDIEYGYDLIRNEYIQIRKVELIGFYTKADFGIAPKPFDSNTTKTDARELTREVDKNSSKTISFYIPEKDSPHIFNDGVNVRVLNDSIAIMMIPQEFSDDAKIKLEYSVNTDNTEPTELRSVLVPLKSQKLERGKSYTMKFTIEKVYKGQIKKGSLKWEQTDLSDSNAGKNWICDTDTISQDFGNE